jgi:hypothetical protein
VVKQRNSLSSAWKKACARRGCVDVRPRGMLTFLCA